MGGNYTPLGGKQFNPDAFLHLGAIRYQGNGVFVLDNDALMAMVNGRAQRAQHDGAPARIRAGFNRTFDRGGARVMAKEIFATDTNTAVSARRPLLSGGGCEGREAEVSSGAVAKRCSVPANSRQTRATTRPAKIDLRSAPSMMEQMAAQWRGNR